MPMTQWGLRIVPCLAGGNASATCLKMLLMRFADVQWPAPLSLHSMFKAQYKCQVIIIIIIIIWTAKYWWLNMISTFCQPYPLLPIIQNIVKTPTKWSMLPLPLPWPAPGTEMTPVLLFGGETDNTLLILLKSYGTIKRNTHWLSRLGPPDYIIVWWRFP